MIIKDLTISLNGRVIVHKLSLTLKPGSLHVLMGPNGSGKSTLAAALMGHPRYAISAGSVTLNGVDITALSPDKRARLGVCLAFQLPYELPGVSVFSLLKEAHEARTGALIDVQQFQELVHEALDAVGLDRSFAGR